MKLVLVLSLILTGCSIKLRTNCEVVTSTVKTIGTCEFFDGTCKVLLENGRTQMALYPVVGESISYRKCEGE